MNRDWIWGWAAALPSTIVALLAIKSTELYLESPYIAVGWALALATTISTGMLWIKNRHSLRKIIQSGGDVQLVIRPVDALTSAAALSIAILNTIILAYLVIQGPAVAGWSLALALVTTISAGIICIKDRQGLARVNHSSNEIKRHRKYRRVLGIAYLFGRDLWNYHIVGCSCPRESRPRVGNYRYRPWVISMEPSGHGLQEARMTRAGGGTTSRHSGESRNP
ncbi:MAG TPA: hypothetical protein VF548_16775 [Allosphingosinicella sp.]|jgi:hypothetical protein